MKDLIRSIVLHVATDGFDSKPTIVDVTFCENSTSLQIGKLTVHIPWSEMAHWQAWLADRVEEEG